MAKWKMNAPYPGGQVPGRGIVAYGEEFETTEEEFLADGKTRHPHYEPAHEMWIPLDAAAEAEVEKAKKRAEELNKQRAADNAERKRLEDEAAGGQVGRKFQTKPDVQAENEARQGLREATGSPDTDRIQKAAKEDRDQREQERQAQQQQQQTADQRAAATGKPATAAAPQAKK